MSLTTINGLVTHYKIEGKGTPLLLLHGWGGSSESFYKVQKILMARYQVISIDFPGFGETDVPEHPWGVEEYKDFIIAFLDKLNIDTCVIVAHSFGGRVALLLAAVHPGRFRALVLIAAAGMKHEHSAQEKAAGFVARMGKRIISLPFLDKLEKPARSLFYRLIRRKDYFFAQGVMRKTMQKVIEKDLSPLLPSIVLPTLIIWGNKYSLTPLEDAHRMHKEIRNSKLYIIKGGSHYLVRRHSLKVASQITAFLSSL